MLELLPLIGAVLTAALGVVGLVIPDTAAAAVGIECRGRLGRSEVRATYGGLFIGLGVACLWLQSTEAFMVAGLAWATAAAARIIALVVDQAVSGRNLAGVIVEGGIGGLLLSAVLQQGL